VSGIALLISQLLRAGWRSAVVFWKALGQAFSFLQSTAASFWCTAGYFDAQCDFLLKVYDESNGRLSSNGISVPESYYTYNYYCNTKVAPISLPNRQKQQIVAARHTCNTLT